MDCILPKIGTHNSATGEKGKGFISLLVTPFSKCQGSDIASQINMGCRYFDKDSLLISMVYGELHTAYGQAKKRLIIY